MPEHENSSSQDPSTSSGDPSASDEKLDGNCKF